MAVNILKFSLTFPNFFFQKHPEKFNETFAQYLEKDICMATEELTKDNTEIAQSRNDILHTSCGMFFFFND